MWRLGVLDGWFAVAAGVFLIALIVISYVVNRLEDTAVTDKKIIDELEAENTQLTADVAQLVGLNTQYAAEVKALSLKIAEGSDTTEDTERLRKLAAALHDNSVRIEAALKATSASGAPNV